VQYTAFATTCQTHKRESVGLVCDDAFVTCNRARVAIWHKEQLPGDSLAVNETDTLRGLIAKARRERDKSVRQLALTAQEAGHRIVGTTLNAIEAGTYKSVPTAETIRAIGWLAAVSDEIAFTAAGRALPGPPFAEELPPGVDDLTSPERKAAITMLRALVAQRQEINRYVDSDLDHSTAAAGTPAQAGQAQVTPLHGAKNGDPVLLPGGIPGERGGKRRPK